MKYAINTLQIELYKQVEAIRVVKRYQAHPEYGGCSESYERDAMVLQKAIAHLQSAEQGESPATDRQQLKAEILLYVSRIIKSCQAMDSATALHTATELEAKLSAV